MDVHRSPLLACIALAGACNDPLSDDPDPPELDESAAGLVAHAEVVP